ncbi:maltose ABC transporter periplasmic protein [Paenibacillus konkukensis]|uniref:Maltose ABC transporter periplasmic protein n=1 Tax=Paenibacillus konkukensis TaxID=2020716 RepID=A0ABY4RVR7_9BACL|nr:extracellular solute-binding protein [Paenibacillus konkukensis]UQZ85454.1 maltose ABC transporter periplasmic protein [Paenibacillus konkukensis]
MKVDAWKGTASLAASGMLLLAVLTGCSGEKDAQGTTSEPPGPAANTDAFDTNLSAHLSMYVDISLPDEWYKKFVIDPVTKKFPNVQLDLIRKGKGTNPSELVVAGTFPDILYNSPPRLNEYKELGLLYDMSDLIKKYQVDVNKLNQPAMDTIKQIGDQGQIVGLPFWVNWSALYYNKDIFDKFGVAYPKDGMTWEEAIELSRQLTRTDNGVNYRGLDQNLSGFTGQLSLGFVDPKTEKPALLQEEGFKRSYEMLLELYKIPGNENRPSTPKDAFLKDRTLAMWPMYADVPSWISDLEAKGETFNWDMAQMPSFKEAPGVSMAVDSHNLYVTSSSPNKEAAFQVIKYLLSEEPQLQLVKNGFLTSSTDQEINKHFGEDMPVFKGKNLKPVFESTPAPKGALHKYDSIVSSEYNKAFPAVESGSKDINSALREAAELAEKRIEEAKKAK